MQKVSREKQVSPSGAGSHTLFRDLNIELWNKDPANNGGKREVFNDLKTQFGRSALSGLGIRMLGGKLPFPVGETRHLVSAFDTVLDNGIFLELTIF